jgi:hypothetical protein
LGYILSDFGPNSSGHPENINPWNGKAPICSGNLTILAPSIDFMKNWHISRKVICDKIATVTFISDNIF